MLFRSGARVLAEVLDAYDRHHVTIGELLQHLCVPRSPSRPALVEVIFNVDRDPSLAGFQGLQFSCQKNAKRALHYDLFFNFVEGPQGLRLECDYNADLYDYKTIERWLGHFQTLLGAIVGEPTSTLEALPLLSEVEHKQITVEWNDKIGRAHV